MKDENRLKAQKSISKILIIILIAIILVIISARYVTYEEFRVFVNTKILKKDVVEATLNTIEIESDTNPYIYAYDKYITVFGKNKLIEYTSDGKISAELNMNISVPLLSSNGEYMVVAEKNGSRLYLVSGENILWNKEVECDISNVNVNKNWYVSIVIKNTTYKSVVAFYDLSGTELFRTY